MVPEELLSYHHAWQSHTNHLLLYQISPISDENRATLIRSIESRSVVVVIVLVLKMSYGILQSPMTQAFCSAGPGGNSTKYAGTATANKCRAGPEKHSRHTRRDCGSCTDGPQ
jgi:hypothetical protein